jgi:hypothetical protein
MDGDPRTPSWFERWDYLPSDATCASYSSVRFRPSVRTLDPERLGDRTLERHGHRHAPAGQGIARQEHPTRASGGRGRKGGGCWGPAPPGGRVDGDAGARAIAGFGANAGRAGYGAKGPLYWIVGGLAVGAGVRPYDPLGGTRGALVTVAGFQREAAQAGRRESDDAPPLLLARVPHDPAAGSGRAACPSRAGLAVPLDLFRERLAGAVSGGLFVRRRRSVRGGEPLVAAA